MAYLCGGKPRNATGFASLANQKSRHPEGSPERRGHLGGRWETMAIGPQRTDELAINVLPKPPCNKQESSIC
jgi:hypothetical protein